jgi:RHS repeat-associated protein
MSPFLGSISRVSAQEDQYDNTILNGYQYLGDSTIVQQDRSQSGAGWSGLDLTYIRQPGDTLYSSDGGDRYTGLDRFGRVIDQYWTNLNNPTSPSERLLYGYDADGNVLYEDNVVNSNYSQVFTYDDLNRLTGFTQETLNSTRTGITGTPTDSGTYTDDALGNMTTYGSGSRTVNAQNELTSGSETPGYDADGNMTTGLPVSTSGGTVNGTMTYDAWGDVVGIAYGTHTETYYFDADGMRVETITPAGTYGTAYSASGQALEDDQGSYHTTYVWGIDYVNDLVSEDYGTGLTSSHTYALHDANYDVIEVMQQGYPYVEMVYEPFGAVDVIAAYSSPIYTADYNFGFQGGRYDTYTQTYWFDNRVYAPALGTWLEQDPAGYVDSTDRYQSFHSDPVNHVDPAGLESWVFIQPEITLGPDLSHTPSTPIGEITISIDAKFTNPANNEATLTLRFRWHPLTNDSVQEAGGFQLNAGAGKTSPITPEGVPNPSQMRDQTASIGLGTIHCGETRYYVVYIDPINIGPNIKRSDAWWWKIDARVTMGGPHGAIDEQVDLYINTLLQEANGSSLPPYPKP